MTKLIIWQQSKPTPKQQSAHSLRCDDCGATFLTQSGADVHTSDTGHTWFTELDPQLGYEGKAQCEQRSAKVKIRFEPTGCWVSRRDGRFRYALLLTAG